MKFRKLKNDEIDVKVGSVTKSGYTLLLYKNARVDMAILDETVGCSNWQRDHKEVKGNLYCGIGINFPLVTPDVNQNVISDRWVWKWDCGVESAFGDKEKGEASDSFKRAGFNWGIGRELYTSPFIFVDCETKYDDGKKVYKIASADEQKRSQHMKIKEITYNDKGEIDRIVVVDNKGVQVYPKTTTDTIQKVEEKKKSQYSGYQCELCTEDISDKVANYSKQHFGKVLCYNCQKSESKPQEVEV